MKDTANSPDSCIFFLFTFVVLAAVAAVVKSHWLVAQSLSVCTLSLQSIGMYALDSVCLLEVCCWNRFVCFVADVCVCVFSSHCDRFNCCRYMRGIQTWLHELANKWLSEWVGWTNANESRSLNTYSIAVYGTGQRTLFESPKRPIDWSMNNVHTTQVS